MSSAACNADPPPGMQFKVEDFTENFKWPEYIVFVAVLIASLGIGVFYGCFGSKSKSNEEFLMAGRSMSITPVTLSLVCRYEVIKICLLKNSNDFISNFDLEQFIIYLQLCVRRDVIR